MDDEFRDLQRLLRLKRYEIPPPEAHDDFMFEFHRRQREEILRRPLWRLALDRFEAAVPNFQPVRYAYTGACATAVIAASLVSAHILMAPATVRTVAENNPPARQQPVNIFAPRPSTRFAPELNFDSPRQVNASATRTRYVLDESPIQRVVYEQRSDF